MSQLFPAPLLPYREEISEIAKRLSNFYINGKKIEYLDALDRVIKWLENFVRLDFHDLKQPLMLLQRIEFLSASTIYDKIIDDAKGLLNDPDAFIAPLGEDTESSFRITANLNQHKNWFGSIEQLLAKAPESGCKIVLFDDFLNSGGQLLTIFKRLLGASFGDNEINDEGDRRLELNEKLKGVLRRSEIYIFFYKAFNEGIQAIEEQNRRLLNLNLRIFCHNISNNNSGFFGDQNDQDRIKYNLDGRVETNCAIMGSEFRSFNKLYELMSEVGTKLLMANEPNWEVEKVKRRNLGYGNTAQVIITQNNIPTVTLTALWHGGDILLNEQLFHWDELLPRRKKVLPDHQQVQASREQPKAVSPLEALTEGENSSESTFKAVHDFTLKYYIKKTISGNNHTDFTDAFFAKSYKYLKNFAKATRRGLEIEPDSFLSILDFVTLKDATKVNQTSLLVKGDAGCGKSLLLSTLYLYLHQQFVNAKIPFLPVYINLHHYQRSRYQGKDGYLNLNDAASKAFEDDMTVFEPVFNLSGKLPILLIVDGVDENKNNKVDIDGLVFKSLEKVNSPIKVIGLRTQDTDFKRDMSVTFIDSPDIILELKAMDTKSSKLDSMLLSFAEFRDQLSGNGVVEIYNHYRQVISNYKLESLDPFLLEVLWSGMVKPYVYRDANTLSNYYERYISSKYIDLSKAAELSYGLFNKKKNVIEKEKNSKEWWFVQKHGSFRDFFVAYYVVKKLSDFNANNQQTFNYVYPYDLNKFCKELINKSIDTQNKTFSSIQKIIPKLNTRDKITAKTHLCYLLGRYQDNAIKEKAKRELIKLKQVVFNSLNAKITQDSHDQLDTDEERQDLLLMRTIYISLTYLGDAATSVEYIKQLVCNKHFDNLNRGFHLEYYEDIVFDSSPNNLKHEDNLKDYTRTFLKLSERLKDAIATGQKYPMFEIELYTLASLAQHRQVNPKFTADELSKRKEIVHLITAHKHFDISEELDAYLTFVVRNLEVDAELSIAAFARKLFSLKSIKRRGWELREVVYPESVAAHMYGCYLLALLYLPGYKANDPGYDKEKILKMILIHDIGEAHIGDLAPHEKKDKDVVEEERFMYRTSLLGTYTGISNVSDFKLLFYEYNHSENINAKIARDLDKLDNLLQLYIYRKTRELTVPVDNFEYFKNDLINSIKTEEGRRIKDIILELYKNLED